MPFATVAAFIISEHILFSLHRWLFKTHKTEDTAAARPLVTVPELCVVTAALLLPLLSCVHPSASSQLHLSFISAALHHLYPWRSFLGTLGQLEDLVWLYMQAYLWAAWRCHGSLVSLVYIHHGSLTGVLSDVCFSWIGNGSNLEAWDECAGWTERVLSTCQAHWTMTVSHHCRFFQPWPLTPPPPLVSSGWGGEQKPPAGWQQSEMCVCQQPIVRESACRWNLWCLPTLCSTGRAHRLATTVKCMIRRAWRPFLPPSHPHIEI